MIIKQILRRIIGRERRRIRRHDLTTFCSTTFGYCGKIYGALMTKVSEHGARFRVTGGDHPSLADGAEVTQYRIKTPYGTFSCAGVVIWAKKTAGYYDWYVAFRPSSSDAKEPLRLLLDSPF